MREGKDLFLPGVLVKGNLTPLQCLLMLEHPFHFHVFPFSSQA